LILKLHRTYLLCFLFTLAVSLPGRTETNRSDSGRQFDFGFIASRHQDVNGDWRLKVLGPLYEKAAAADGMRMKAARPFYSDAQDPAHDRSLVDYAWPLATSRTVHDENQWRWLIFYGFNHTTNDPGQRYRTWLFPFYFQGRDASGETYRALFPLGGTIKDFAGRDEVNFILFPLHSTSTFKDLSTVNYLWPLISRTTSEDGRIYRARFFPFYGVNYREGKYNKHFILWPFYTDVTYDYKNSKGKGHILFPIFGRLNLNTEKTWWVLPPFFRFTKGDDGTIVHAPWPFFQRHKRKDVDKFYLWPLWGHLKLDVVERRFLLWPFIWSIDQSQHKAHVHRSFIIPFYYRAVKTTTPDVSDLEPPKVIARSYKVWPLYSYRSEGSNSFFRTLELWPFGGTPSVERNWSPIWSLYTRSASGNNVDHEVLWGLYRDQRRSDSYHYRSLFPIYDYRRNDQVEQPERSWNILKGLVGYERKGSRKTIRLLYVIRF
jgi:hypothetical protein